MHTILTVGEDNVLTLRLGADVAGIAPYGISESGLPFSTICRLYIKGDFLPVFLAARQGIVRVSILLFRLDQLQSYAVGIKRDRLPSPTM
ncbi:MAG: hypothetical protein OXC26_25900 [Albidovulum sp.]|nr:hypothetical protein [Albidovulum sp.]